VIFSTGVALNRSRDINDIIETSVKSSLEYYNSVDVKVTQKKQFFRPVDRIIIIVLNLAKEKEDNCEH